MSDVVPFPSKVVPDTIWVCGCGCCSFALLDGGRTTCSACGNDTAVSAAGGWFVPPSPGLVWGGNTPVTHITGNGSPEFARRRMTRFANEEDVAGIIIIRDSGQLHTWTDVDTNEGVQWLQERMKDAAGLITEDAVDE